MDSDNTSHQTLRPKPEDCGVTAENATAQWTEVKLVLLYCVIQFCACVICFCKPQV